MKFIHLFVFVLCALINEGHASVQRQANNYYISPDGNDDNPGTFAKPWKTLEKANQTLKPGDVAIFRNGTYSGNINPHSESIPGKFITYRSENVHGSVLTGSAGHNYIAELTDKHFIKIDGFKMLPDRGGFGIIKKSSHIYFINCHMEHSTGVFIQLHFIESNYNKIINCNIWRAIDRTADSRIHGDGCRLTNSSYNVIESNTFSKIGHSPLNFYATSPELCSNNVIRGNCFHNGWGRNFEFFNPYRCLFEDNIITDAFNGATSASSYSKVFFYNSIFRNCLIYDNWDGVLGTNSYNAFLGDKQKDPVMLELNNSRIYNNTFVNNLSVVWSLNSMPGEKTSPVKSNKFVNNLFSRNGFSGNSQQVLLGKGVSGDNLFINNIFNEKPDQASVKVLDKEYSSNDLNSQLPELFRDNKDADPEFVSFENRCLALNPGSAAIDAGSILTKTISSGSGKELNVEDAGFFFDGFGIEGEKGDLICIGKPGNLARVIKADIDKNILIIDRKMSWKEGDPVSMPYSGKAPDIGAFETGETGILSFVPMADPMIAGKNQDISFNAMISGSKGKVSMEWDFGDGVVSHESSPVHSYKDYGDYFIRVSCRDGAGSLAKRIFFVRIEKTVDPRESLMQTGFEERDFEEWGHLWDRGPSRERFTFYPVAREDGKGQCMCVSTEGKNSVLATNVKFRVWEIDKYPYVRFSYRIPKGVPVGVWLRPWSSNDQSSGVCLGGSRNNSSGNSVDLKKFVLIDDGQWHEILFDARDIRTALKDLKLIYSFEFMTYAETKEGQMFWFDDFEILPIRN